MSAIPRPPLFIQFLLACLSLALLAGPALAARLETDRSEIEVGDVVTIRVAKKPFIAVITNWKATGALELVSSDDDTAKVRALRPGTGTVGMRMNGSPNSIELTVREPAAAPPPLPIYPPMPAVQAPPAQPMPIPPPATSASLRLDRDRFVTGEAFTVHFTAPGSWPNDAWVGIIPSAIPHGDERQNDNHDIAYQYLGKRTAGSLTFTAPSAGDWDLRLHDTDNGGKEFASVGFRVDAAAPTGGREYTAAPMPGGRDYTASTPAANTGLAGMWTIVANNYTGKLELTEHGGQLAGRVWFDVYQTWEDLREIAFDGRTLRFLRPGPSQRYTGVLDGDTVRGSFDQGGGGSWNWSISRVPTSPSTQIPAGKPVLIDDLGPYSWIEASEVQTRLVQAGRAAFRATGNNHFTHRLGIVGDYADQYRYLDFWIYLDNPGADIQLQVQVDGTWAKRWGFDAEPVYNGYGWTMEGASAGLPSGRWLRQRIDLIEQLKIAAGQAVTGLAFSSDGGDVYYDSVYLLANSAPLPPPDIRPHGKRILEDDAGPYAWIESSTVQNEVVGHGQAAFKSTGNNHFTAELGVVGDYPDQFRHIVLWLFPIGREADLQLQVQVDGTWGKRWGFDAGPAYNGYGWTMEGATANLKPGAWQEVELDLIADLRINPGQRITGLAFSSDGGDVYYDAVQLHPNPTPARKPAFKPVGKPVLEDGVEPYAWVDGTETQDYLVFHGAKSFRSTGNNHFTADLGAAGTAPDQYRGLDFWAFFMGPEADLQIQVQVNGAWGKRWGYDAGPVYNGYGWAMEGTTAGLPSGRWTHIRLDLLDQLHLAPGDRITGLAFSSDNADVVYDSVYLLPDRMR